MDLKRRVALLEENEVKTREVLTQFNLNPNDFNPLLTQELGLIPLDKNTNRLELELPIIIENSRKNRKNDTKNT